MVDLLFIDKLGQYKQKHLYPQKLVWPPVARNRRLTASHLGMFEYAREWILLFKINEAIAQDSNVDARKCYTVWMHTGQSKSLKLDFTPEEKGLRFKKRHDQGIGWYCFTLPIQKKGHKDWKHHYPALGWKRFVQNTTFRIKAETSKDEQIFVTFDKDLLLMT
jgi:hypothetical protein